MAITKNNRLVFLRGVAQLVARVLWEHDAAGSNPVTPTRGENSLSQDERTAHIFNRSTNWQGGTHESELQRGYELFKLIQIGDGSHLMPKWRNGRRT